MSILSPHQFLLSPAKINLGLQVFHRREADSRHYLASIFVPIDFGDEIAFEPATSDGFDSTNELPEHCFADFEAVSERGNLSNNLIWQLLERTRAERPPLLVRLTKRCPTGAGLGGGSSNAAQLLRHLMRTNCLRRRTATALANEFGSDIAFFLQEGPQLAFGTGDLLEPILLGPGCGVLAMPPLHSSTGAAYTALKRPLQSLPAPKSWPTLDERVRSALARSAWSEAKELTNDFEEVVFEREPSLAKIKESLLSHGALYASLSGSGSALFGLTATQSDARELARKLGEKFNAVRFVAFSFVGS